MRVPQKPAFSLSQDRLETDARIVLEAPLDHWKLESLSFSTGCELEKQTLDMLKLYIH